MISSAIFPDAIAAGEVALHTLIDMFFSKSERRPQDYLISLPPLLEFRQEPKTNVPFGAQGQAFAEP